MSEHSQRLFESDDVVIDLERPSVTKAGAAVSLTRTEWMLLESLVYEAGSVVPSGVLLSRVWGADYQNDLPFLRTWLSRLSVKLETDPIQPRIIVPQASGCAIYRNA